MRTKIAALALCSALLLPFSSTPLVSVGESMIEKSVQPNTVTEQIEDSEDSFEEKVFWENNYQNDTPSYRDDDISDPDSHLCTIEHSFGEWSEITPPTYLTCGVERRDCLNCEEYETREIEKLDAEGLAAINNATGTTYETLAEALNAAESGSTVTLLSDVSVGKNDVVDLAGMYKTFFCIKGKTLTVDLNGKQLFGDAAGMEEMLVGFFSTESDGHLTLNDSVGNASVRIEANGANVYGLLINYDPSSTLTVNGGNYSLDFASDSLVYSGGNECITVNGGNFYLGNIATDRNQSPWIFNVKGRNERHVCVNGGSFNWDIQHQYWPFEVEVPKELALQKTTVNGEAIYSIVKAVAYVNEQEYSGRWYTNNIGYATLEGAIAAADTPAKATIKECVTLLSDVTISTPIAINKDLTIDLGGNTVTASGLSDNTGAFTVLSDVTFKNGKINASEGYALLVGDDGSSAKLTIENGEYFGSTTAVFVKRGELTVLDGYFGTSSDIDNHQYTLDCDDESYMRGEASIAVHAGTFYRFDPSNNLAEGAGTDFTADENVNVEIDWGNEAEDPSANLTVTKKPSLLPSDTVNIGETITYTITVTNTGDRSKTISVTDKLPNNTEYLFGADSVNGNDLAWNDITLSAGQTVTLSYSVKVASDASLYTDGIIRSESASVNGISAFAYPIYVRRTLTENDAEYLKAAILALSDSTYTSSTLLKWIYQVAFSKTPVIKADANEVLNTLYTVFDDTTDALRNNVAPTLYGGIGVSATKDAYFNGARAETISENNFINGDVLLISDGSQGRMYLYFDAFIELTDGMRAANTATVLASIQGAEYYAVFRPSIAFPNVAISQGMVDPSTLSEYERTLLLTAQYYLLRGERIQYDDTRLSYISNSEFRWQYGYLTPEDYTSDAWGYTNCAAFAYDLYLYALNQNITNYTTSGLIGRTSLRAYLYQPSRQESASARAEQQEKFLSALKVGDIIVIRRDKDGNGSDDSGHAMIYVGDGRVIHSAGSNYNYSTSVEVYEPTLRYMDISEYLYSPESSNYLFGSTVTKLAIIRPLKSFSGNVPQNSANRVERLDGIRAEKLSSHSSSVTANEGDVITYTFKIFNADPFAKNVSISDVIPSGTTFVSVTGGSHTEGNISFELTVGAYETVSVSYDVRVNEGAKKITSGTAKINGVSFNCPAVTIKNTLDANEQLLIKQSIEYFLQNGTSGLSGLELANAIYERAGLDAPFAEEDSFKNVIYGVASKYNGSSSYIKLASSGKYRDLLVEGLYGGRYFYTAARDYINRNNVRTRLLKPDDLVAGDVILAKSSTAEKVYVYDGEFIYDLTASGIDKQEPAPRLERLMAFQYYFMVLRPSFR
ncbi:MAG: DUF11 domain-containing protein [Ruminococcaceae bacterium]|nr:DUF11 domain-containing protein [Oscillospiraceae bacterium]